ncbi:helix-turn-helix domain-containing protein [Streptosporangium sp. NPDC050280]|uniref:helix-turn-helix domain-containing protein n=1 Tax=unclassified Streptosporangium TaxID=2632669 RepID=UPI00344635CD
MARKGRRATFEEKVFALRLMEQGMSPDRVAETLGVGRESVFRWKRQARAGGEEALRIKRAPGRPRRLTSGQEQSVKAVVVMSPPVRCWGWRRRCGRGRWWRW